MKVLLVDDQRMPEFIRNPFKEPEKDDWFGPYFTDEEVIVARSYSEGIKLLESQHWDLLLLDHDLGEAKTGYDIICWLEVNPDKVPKNLFLVTANPVGGMRMMQVIQRFEERGLVAQSGWLRE